MILTKKVRRFNAFLSTLLLIFMVMGGLKVTASKPYNYSSNTVLSNNNTSALPPSNSVCSSNILANEIIVSISSRHLWACSKSTLVYNTPVVTGDESYVADATPIGSYKIYDKLTNQTLTGSDQMGSWSDPVKYWMPFLSNQYGIFGLHDASWRTQDQFGNIAPNSLNASHGCVELPNNAAAWLYNWAPVGTTVRINA